MWTTLMFLPLNLNDSTIEHWTERLIFFISFWSKKILYQVTRHKKFWEEIF